MTTRPILFSAEMVRAILEGRKTQTRRIASVEWDTSHYWGSYDCWTFSKKGKPLIGFGTSNRGQDTLIGHCPFGKIGDRLWVRETWRAMNDNELLDTINYFADNAIMKPKGLTEQQGYRFSSECDEECARNIDGLGKRWKPSIHMPRWASRITLEITNVRVERVQEISKADARAEGIADEYDEWREEVSHYAPPGESSFETEIDWFKRRWNTIHPGSWERNDFCWVLDFRRIK